MAPIKLQNPPPAAEESDGELSGGDSDRSNTSRENDAGRDSSDGDEDSEDSSEMDEKECDTRRTECMDNLTDLEGQFQVLREQLYRERIAQIQFQLEEIRNERSQEYLAPLAELKENMKIRNEVAGILRELRNANIEHKFKSEEQAAAQNFLSEKALAWDYYYEELIEKIRRLEEDRHNVEISWSEGGEWGTRSRSRSRRKAVTVSGPYIVYMLKPQDIIEDWTIIKKALKRTA